MAKLLFGSDPEFFAGYKQDGKVFVLPPVYFRQYLGIEPVIKDDRHPVFIDERKESGVMIIEDGVAFEETVQPSTDWKEVFERINYGKKLLSAKILSKFPEHCDGEVHTLPTINYDIDRWGKEKRSFQLCNIFGCDQDWDAFSYDKNQHVVDALKHGFRYGGGHIHISGCKMFKQEPILAVKNLAMSAGLAAVAFSNVPELDKARTYLYGKPGKFRPQTYASSWNRMWYTGFGIEYRTPSNAWTDNFNQAEQIFKWIEIGVRNLFETGLGKKLLKKISEDVQDAIVNCDQPKAKDLLAYIEAKI